MRKLLAIWAAIFFAAHLPFLPPSLEDLDSISLALGVRGADPLQFPPPIHFIAAAKALTAVLHRFGDPLNAPHALALVNLLGAALGLIAIAALARALRFSTWRAAAVAIVAGGTPLYWFTASRPLADLAGLAVAMAAQALLARAWLTGDSRRAIAGAAVAGASMGVRLAAGALSVPLVVALLVNRRVTNRTRAGIVGGLVAGVLTWVVPVMVSRGPAWFGAQALDLPAAAGGPGTLAAEPSLAALGDALYATFVDPFGGQILASIVIGVAMAGVAIALRRERGVLTVLAIAYVPYIVFHLLFHDTNMARWALPVVPPLALLFVLPLEYVSRKAVLPAAAGVAAAGLVVAVPALQEYAAAESPGLRLVRDLHQLPRTGETVLAMHQRAAEDLHHYAQWTPAPSMRALPPARDHEWLEMVKLWQDGFEGPIWFLADPRRTDLALIDPQRRRLLAQYAWPEGTLPFMRGARPGRLNWYFIQGPGWFLGRGWALSPEIGRLTARGRDQSHTPVAWVRRRDTPATLLLGGRHLGAASDPPIVVRVKIDGRQVDEWPINPGPFVFMRPLLPEEIAGAGTYARLEIDATQAGAARAPLSLEQFDLQSIDGTLVAYDEGWWEPEYSERTGRSWRWTSRESKLWVFNPGRDLTLAISGEDPTRYYGKPIEMIVLAGDRELARLTLDDHFTRTVTIPVEPLSVARGRITLRFSDSHVPGRLRLSPDQRELGIRIFDVKVH